MPNIQAKDSNVPRCLCSLFLITPVILLHPLRRDMEKFI